jgi:pilus assembly protein FimV
VCKKAVALGRQLDPSNPMFGEGGGAAAAAAAGAGAALVAGAAHALKPAPEARKEPPHEPGAGASTTIAKEMEGEGDNALDFRFDQDVSITRTPKTTKAQMDLIDAAEREFEESAKRAAASAKPAAGAPGSAAGAAAPEFGAVGSGQASAASDFEFHLDEAEKPAPLQKPAAGTAPGEGDSVSPALARPQAAIDLDKLDLSFDAAHATFEDPTPSVLDGQWHDAATKLDLAKAYQEMGDVEGAREILQEVLHEGDDAQKAEAQSLLAKLG